MPDFIKCRNNFDEIVEIPKEKFFFRPSVYAIIKRDDSIIVLNTKGNNKIWFPGGGVEIGENMHDALKRECDEEIGLELKSIQSLLLFKENFFYFQPTDEAMHAYLFFFLCEAAGESLDDLKIGADEDIKNPRWMKISDIRKDDINDLAEEVYQMLNNLK